VAPYDEVPETGATFTDNALLKAREAVLHTGMVSVADDSGIAIDALNGMPGVLSARWAGSRKSDAANLQLVLEQLATRLMSDAAEPSSAWRPGHAVRRGWAVGRGDRRRGLMPGRVVREPRGSNGFGYDPIFVADGKDVTNGNSRRPRRMRSAIAARRCVGWLRILQRRSGDRSDRVIVSADRPIGRSFRLPFVRFRAAGPAAIGRLALLPSFLPSLLLPSFLSDGADILLILLGIQGRQSYCRSRRIRRVFDPSTRPPTVLDDCPHPVMSPPGPPLRRRVLRWSRRWQ